MERRQVYVISHEGECGSTGTESGLRADREGTAPSVWGTGRGRVRAEAAGGSSPGSCGSGSHPTPEPPCPCEMGLNSFLKVTDGSAGQAPGKCPPSCWPRPARPSNDSRGCFWVGHRPQSAFTPSLPPPPPLGELESGQRRVSVDLEAENQSHWATRTGNVGAEPGSSKGPRSAADGTVCVLSPVKGALRAHTASSRDQGDVAWAGDSLFTHVCHQQGHASERLAW